MSEQPSDPYCHRKLREETAKADEEAFFEIWWRLRQHKHWEARYPNERCPPEWGEGYKDSMKEGWMARASLHVTQAAKAGVENGD